jgi:hypothetical protein
VLGVGNEPAGFRAARGDFAEDRDDFVAVDELVDFVRRLLGVRLVVLEKDADLLALDAARRVDLVGCHVDPFARVDAEGRFLT